MLAVESEFHGCEFGDKRLNKRVKNLASTISENPETSLHAACGSATDSKAAYRFLQSEKVRPSGLLSAHVSKTVERIAEQNDDILIVHDTTDLIYTHYPSVEDLGVLHKAKGFEGGVKGMMLHNSIAVTRSGVPLGVLRQTFYTNEDYRDKKGTTDINVRDAHKRVPIDKKKSYRWIEHFNSTEDLLAHGPQKIIHVADRECDIFEFLDEVISRDSHYVIRSSSNRMTRIGPRLKDTETIQKTLDESPIKGHLSVIKGMKTINCELRFVSVKLKSPQRLPEAQNKKLDDLRTSIVEVRSKEGDLETLHWRLLTNLPCTNEGEALAIVEVYKQRWTVECFHRILKSGFGVEKARLKNRKRIENLASLLSVVAWHIFWLYTFARSCPSLNANTIFEEETIKVLRISAKKLKVNLPSQFTIKQAVLVLARLGGFAGRKGDGEPGMQNLWRGWNKLHERISFMEEMTYG